MTARRRARIALIGGILAVQLVVPPLALRHVRPAALGWHMFVGTTPKPDATLIFVDGATRRLDIDDVVKRARPEIHYPSRLTTELCARYDDLASVRYDRDGDVLADVSC